MTPGETRRLWIPEQLAYRGMPGRPAGMLVFDVTLYSVKQTPKPPPAPVDVAGIPADATVTASGLASRARSSGPPPTQLGRRQSCMGRWQPCCGRAEQLQKPRAALADGRCLRLAPRAPKSHRRRTP